MKRREFFGWFSLGALVSSLSVVIAACSQSSSSPNFSRKTEETASEPSSVIRSDGFITVGTLAELNKNEQIFDHKNEIVVVQNPTNRQLSALNFKCTHQGCPVGWDQSSQLLMCPCHGSKFNSQGEVIKGPAGQPLKTYSVKEENGLVWVKLS